MACNSLVTPHLCFSCKEKNNMDAPSPKYHNHLALHQSEGPTDDNFDFHLDHHESFHVVFIGKLDTSKGS